MIKYFNAFQLVSLFSAGPFLIQFVNGADFYAHMVLFWVLLVGYIVGFFAMITLVGDNL